MSARLITHQYTCQKMISIGNALKMFQLHYEMLKLELHKIQGKSHRPVDFQKVRCDEAHSEFALADVVETTARISAILPKECIKSAVESFMWGITFFGIHNRPDFVIFGSLRDCI
jgi:hypothetical protein